jgi:hypothetical protein
LTLKERIAADASAVFLNEDDFATEITRRIGGEPDNTETLLAIVEWDTELGTNEMPGEARNISDRTGQPLRRTVLLEVPIATAEQLVPQKDAFVVGGTVVTFKRIIGRDDALATLYCVVSESLSTKITRVRP